MDEPRRHKHSYSGDQGAESGGVHPLKGLEFYICACNFLYIYELCLAVATQLTMQAGMDYSLVPAQIAEW